MWEQWRRGRHVIGKDRREQIRWGKNEEEENGAKGECEAETGRYHWLTLASVGAWCVDSQVELTGWQHHEETDDRERGVEKRSPALLCLPCLSGVSRLMLSRTIYESCVVHERFIDVRKELRIASSKCCTKSDQWPCFFALFACLGDAAEDDWGVQCYMDEDALMSGRSLCSR